MIFVSFLQQSSDPAAEHDVPFDLGDCSRFSRRADSTMKPEIATASEPAAERDVPFDLGDRSSFPSRADTTAERDLSSSVQLISVSIKWESY